MKIHFIRSNQKRKIISQLNEQFGITKVPHLLIESGKEKIRGYSGSLSKEEIQELNNILHIESLGLYLMSARDADLRLSIEGSHFFQDQITKNTVKINPSELDKWLHGQDLNIKVPTATVIIKNQDDLIGSGKSNGEKIFNYIPKDRRLKNS
ncbi:hypothetical protein CMI47_02260 [Candidatus Pacearchaeota archaeon]|nr:hypothetical protein [Candidatus Pacearchaeota archaeon]|tara:strand:- start:1017 stop:1472 length:456 start_codon:yes stop_codon:yes gene_type:complete